MLIQYCYVLEDINKEKKDKISCSKVISKVEAGVGEKQLGTYPISLKNAMEYYLIRGETLLKFLAISGGFGGHIYKMVRF